MLTKSSGGFVGLMAVIFYSIMKSNRKFVFFTLVCFLGLFLFMVAPSHYWEEMGTISSEATKKSDKYNVEQGTGSQRLYAWKLGWGMFKEHPILGVGQGNYPWNVVEQEEKMGVQWQERSLGGRAAHSLYFTLLPELGLVGGVLFFMIVIYIWKDLKNVRKIINKGDRILKGDEKNIYYYTLAIEAGTIGFLFSSIFISTLYYPNFWILTAIMLSLRNVVVNSQYVKSVPPVPSSGDNSGSTMARKMIPSLNTSHR
jgi:O-antigen ligase